MQSSRIPGVFVTGTDTGVGKTFVSAALAQAAADLPMRTRYFKPIQTGDDDDCATLTQLAGAKVEIQSPVYQFSLPAAPSRAARAEHRSVEFAPILQTFARGCEHRSPPPWTVTEGAGGLLVPIDDRERLTMLDLAAALKLPLLIVASTRLGTINHTLLTLACARQAGLVIAGWVLNGDADPGLRECIAAHAPDVLCLGEFSREPDAGMIGLRNRATARAVVERLIEMRDEKSS